ncbi:MAG: tRNA (uridine(34)/cytosine(34)/5-carboxymethylaminomethyluridine(34)-2'-O)-methyltransferase TrmL [Legionellaceae bacterium]|nr:tRNA (uridine(34)/cytosine(34)/5-carboxymethylaminomethyluridine(34)-2'-O)-methyltransferase TrmL [Legionellaceae bacterium]|tara:strand:- start:192 stop:647 length:456 start_codon:yes stop_codon:yes gene_type:complete
MFNIVLHSPQIPPNTGNIIRLCANCGSDLHLIEPLGFELDDKKLKRAGLDYHEWANVKVYKNFESFLEQVKPTRLFAIETCGERLYTDVQYEPGDTIVFGSETWGLSDDDLTHFKKENVLLIPMKPKNRSLNLSNSAALVLYEAWRQQGFC